MGASAVLDDVDQAEAARGKSRGEAVYQGLRRAIIEAALRPGTKLPEDAVGESFGVSRTVVRGVLTRLAGEGLIETLPNRSTMVSNIGTSITCP